MLKIMTNIVCGDSETFSEFKLRSDKIIPFCNPQVEGGDKHESNGVSSYDWAVDSDAGAGSESSPNLDLARE